MRSKNIGNNFDLCSGYFAQSWLWWINRRIWRFLLVLLYSSEVSDVELVAKNASPCWRRTSTTRNELNQSETPSLDSWHCWNFNAGIKKLDFPMLPYTIIVEIPIEIFLDKNKIQTVVTREHAFNYPAKTVSRHLLEFSRNQDFDGCCKKFLISFLLSYTALTLSLVDEVRV